jgi:3',5'-cyclic-AMP phosphodiesterase
MLIAQLSDLHLGFSGDAHDEANVLRTAAVLRKLAALDRAPDLMLVTGDLTEHGDEASAMRLAEMLRALPYPAHVIPGNHDTRQALRTAFAPPEHDGFIQYVIEGEDLRIVMLDTLEPGRAGGAFCERRARWLAATLDAAPEQPTLIALHHPPFNCGVDWIAARRDEPWVQRIEAAVRGRENIVGMICGHVHRPITGRCAGVPVEIAPSVAPGLALTLAPVDLERPDDRPMIIDDLPGFALHWWRRGTMVSYVVTLEEPVVLARYDARMQPQVAEMMQERDGELPSL